MTHKVLESYLRTYRKRSGFSQKEMAFLLNCHTGSKISRYEHFKRMPNLQTAFGYEAVFKVPVHEIFAGVYRKVEQRTNRRIQLLIQIIDAKPSSVLNDEKLSVLRKIKHS